MEKICPVFMVLMAVAHKEVIFENSENLTRIYSPFVLLQFYSVLVLLISLYF